MAQDDIVIKLPGSKGEAIIRPYIKNKDRRAFRRAVLEPNEFNQKDIENRTKENGDIEFTIKGEALNNVMDLQIKCLLLSYEGDSENPFDKMMESEYKEDMEAVEEAVKKIFDKEDSTSEKKSKAGKQTTAAR